jgi:flagellar protein FliS
MYQQATRSYEQANYFTADPLKLIIMCYDGAIAHLKISRDHYRAGEYEAKARNLQKTLDIIHELNASLDLEKGGDVARNLRSLYQYMVQILTQADLKRDIRVFDQVISMLEELASGWKEIANGSPEKIHPVPHGSMEVTRQGPMSERGWSV